MKEKTKYQKIGDHFRSKHSGAPLDYKFKITKDEMVYRCQYCFEIIAIEDLDKFVKVTGEKPKKSKGWEGGSGMAPECPLGNEEKVSNKRTIITGLAITAVLVFTLFFVGLGMERNGLILASEGDLRVAVDGHGNVYVEQYHNETTGFHSRGWNKAYEAPSLEDAKVWAADEQRRVRQQRENARRSKQRRVIKLYPIAEEE